MDHILKLVLELMAEQDKKREAQAEIIKKL
jgi:hypothetical protein